MSGCRSAGRPRQDGTAGREPAPASTAARSPASSIRSRRRTAAARTPIAGAASTSRSISRRPTRWSTNVPALARRGASTWSSARPAGSSDEPAIRAGGRRRGRRHRRRRRTSRPASCCSRRSSRTRRSCSRRSTSSARCCTRRITRRRRTRRRARRCSLKRAMEQAGFPRPIDVSSTRAGFIPGHAHGRLRRPGRDDHADAHGARSHGVRARRARRGDVGARQARLVHDEGRARRRRVVQSGADAAGRTGLAAGRRACQDGRTAMRTPFTGVGTALVTPFTRSGELDEAAVRRLGRRQIDAGIHFLVPCGTTGENPTLTRRRAAADRRDRRRRSERPGAGAGRRRRLRHEGSDPPRRRDAEGAAPSGLLSVTPYYNKPTQEGLYQHYRAIAESTPLPIVVYNVPGRTGVQRRRRRRSCGSRRFRTSSASRKRPAT